MHKKWDTALKLLWERSRFTSYFYQAVQIQAEEGIPTLALTALSSRLVLLYNEDFINEIDIEELLGLMVHEMLHIVFSHDHRARPDDDPWLQNLAQDMVVNSYCEDNCETFFSRKDQYLWDVPELVLPQGLPVVPPLFYRETGNRDPRWEDVYRWLKDNPGTDLKQYDFSITTPDMDQGAPGTRAPQSDNTADPDIPLQNSRNESMIPGGSMRFTDREGESLTTGIHLFRNHELQNVLEAKKKSILAFMRQDRVCLEERVYRDISAYIERIEEVDVTSWRNEIKSIVDYSSQSDEWTYTYGRFNRRFYGNGIYAPGRIFKNRQHITVAVDVSASMVTRPRDIEEAFGVIEALMGKYIIHLVCVDENLFIPELSGNGFTPSRSNRPYTYRKGDWRHIRSGTSGTTFFAPLFNDYMKHHREMLIVITDGYIYDLDLLGRYSPLLWVISAGRREDFHPPFGKWVKISTGLE